MVLFDSLNYIKKNLDNFILKAITNTSEQLEDVQRDQMQVGENAEGNEIGKLRNVAYAKRKKQKGGIAKLGVVDLKNTGDFYDAIFARVTSKFIEISSSDSKTDLLEEKYGQIIFGLNDYYKQKYFEILIPEIQDLIRNYLKYGTRP
jgi:hypothetical protein